ncbi:MAG: hypothetical protein HYV07_10380 [Deltaproteobacteria bacterium]|nr:hypothetical protein [Deltaproteobacteria bacterium]
MTASGRHARQEPTEPADDTDAEARAYREAVEHDTSEVMARDPIPPRIVSSIDQPDFGAPTIADPELLALAKLGSLPHDDSDDTDATLSTPATGSGRSQTDESPQIQLESGERPVFDDPTIATPAISMSSGELPSFGDPTIATPALAMHHELKAPVLKKPAPKLSKSPPPDPRPEPKAPSVRDSATDPRVTLGDLVDEINPQPDFAGSTLAGAVMYHHVDGDTQLERAQAPAAEVPGSSDPSVKMTAIRRVIPVSDEVPTAPAGGYRVHNLSEQRRSVPPPPSSVQPARPRVTVARKPTRPRGPMVLAVAVSLVAVLLVGIAIAIATR